MFKFLISILLLSSLSGCSTWGNNLWSNSSSLPTVVTYSMYATDSINPNMSGNATPVEFQVFELSDDSMFLSAGFDQLVDDAKAALKSNYVDHRDYVLSPGQFKFIEPFKLDSETFYIGVMARYANPDISDWKKVIKVLPVDHRYHLFLYLDGNQVELKKVE
ncbi:type VI secretion lipoprotein [Shewanella sp. NFH-SH190041]|uniref:type VI secretion system lipoprotein TssJ n=1 Tax=Shewanella sp. NFH-SH190041 TaxID=2950245 RepID=UPI0021C336A3|nr:type VI secretion system lipoprotein TssJ [Shewanella sp. NFH-SH190041]BDM64447.1 type VI secretion lipoprotein [Shewanella sp. NFH-SH190041]